MQGRRSMVAALVGVALAAMLVSASSVFAGGGNSLNAKSCQKLGWKGLVTTTGGSFASEDACVSYAAKGGVLKRPQTVSFTSANPSPVTVGGAYTPAATATSGLPVTITLDATSIGCTLTGSQVSFTEPGTCVIDANQAGNATHNRAAQVQQSITVLKQSQTISFTSTNPSPVLIGRTYTPTATTTGTGLTVTITLDGSSRGCTLSRFGDVRFIEPGTCVIDGNQAGNATYDAAAQVQQSITVDALSDQAACESFGGTLALGTGNVYWTCTALPNATARVWFDPLEAQCFLHSGASFSAQNNGDNTSYARCQGVR